MGKTIKTPPLKGARGMLEKFAKRIIFKENNFPRFFVIEEKTSIFDARKIVLKLLKI